MFQSSPWGIQAPGLALDPNRHGVKRKPNLLAEDVVAAPPPVKRLVTEEEMSLEMQRLQIEAQALPATPSFVHIYQNTVPGTSMSPFVFNSAKFTGFGEQDNCQDVDMLPEKELPRLFISDEIAQIKPQPILPNQIINSRLQNAMALVPYVPRPIPAADPDLDVEEDKTGKASNFLNMDLM